MKLKENKSETKKPLNIHAKKRKSCKQVMPLNIKLTRSLNGKPMTHEEMKSCLFKSDVFSQVLKSVNERVGHNTQCCT